MARRVKESPDTHRERIGAAAEKLFSAKGIEGTTVDEIAREAGYSKATLYVYFKNKEDIVGSLVLKSMTILQERLDRSVHDTGESVDTRTRYDAICSELTSFQEEYPLYFSIALDEINVDFESSDALAVERDIYDVGERTNEIIEFFIEEGKRKGELRADLPVPHTIFLFWAALSGLIVMAANKRPYLEQITGLSKHEFLEDGFATLYRSIQA